MDCSAEEQLVRMTLDSVEGVDSMVFDLDQRTVTVRHEADGEVIESALATVFDRMAAVGLPFIGPFPRPPIWATSR